MQKISPFIWFADGAQEAADFYVSVFPDTKIKNTVQMPDAPGPKGSVYTVSMSIAGENFTLLNGGPLENYDKITGAISFVVNCDSQEEIDKYWDALADGGKPGPCGWITDKFGVVWQIVPTRLAELLSDSDPAKVKRVTQCFMKMSKFDISELEKASNG